MKARSQKKKGSTPATKTDLQRFGNTVTKLERKVGALETDVQQLAEATKVSFDRLESKMGNFEDRMGNFEDRMGNFEDRMGNFEDRMGGVETKLENTERRLTAAIKDGIKEVMDHIDVAVENRKTDLLGVGQDEILLMQKKSRDHEERITTLEQRQGLRS